MSYRSRMDALGNWVGRRFSNFAFVVNLVLGYTGLSLLTWAVVTCLSGDPTKAAQAAYTVATGGDPYPFTGDVNPSAGGFRWLVWQWLRLLHIFSWLLVPVLIASTIDAAYKVNERKRRLAEGRSRRRLRKLGERAGLSGEALEEFVEMGLEMLLEPPD